MTTVRRAHRRSLARRFRRSLRRHVRFNIAVILTILVVAWVAVPNVARFVNAWGGYAPTDYEPKDFERQTWLERHTGPTLLARLAWSDFIGIGLFIVVAVVWLTLVRDRTTRRGPLR
jgi:hypothetical protein